MAEYIWLRRQYAWSIRLDSSEISRQNSFRRAALSVARKGTLFVVAVPAVDDPIEDTLDSIENGKIVHESPLAPHEQETMQFSVSVFSEMAYYMWYRVGGGLHVNNLTMSSLLLFI